MADKAGGKPKKAVSKRFTVTLLLEGAMVDEDTPISEQALIDLFEMQFSSAKGLKVLRVEAQEAS